MQADLEALFSEVGQVVEVFLPSDRMTGRPRGFAFVEFIDAEPITEAIEKFDGYELNGRKIGYL
jgi:RNA recognition motif-containing protein